MKKKFGRIDSRIKIAFKGLPSDVVVLSRVSNNSEAKAVSSPLFTGSPNVPIVHVFFSPRAPLSMFLE